MKLNDTVTFKLDKQLTFVKRLGKGGTGEVYLFKDKEIDKYFNLTIDIGEYKKERENRLERLAKKVAREVAYSKVEAKLDPMNSYERRIIHTILAENKKVITESEGEEPNRYVVIKPKEDE